MSREKTNIIFFGTSDFAATILEQLCLSKGVSVALVVTQPDQPTGRKQIPTPPPVKILSDQLHLKTIQPAKLTIDTAKQLKKTRADLFIVAAYGKIIPQKILSLPAHGCLNVHPSLLPKYRGPSPIQSTLLNGDQKTGITIMLLDEAMDHGPIISQVEYPIGKTDDYLTLSQKLACESAILLLKTIPDFLSGALKPREQDHKQATYTKIITKEDGFIDWQQNATAIFNRWRAFRLWPGVFSQMKINGRDLTVKFQELKLVAEKIDGQKTPGEIFSHNKKLLAACGEDSFLQITKLQPAGKNPMDAPSFINGYLK